MVPTETIPLSCLTDVYRKNNWDISWVYKLVKNFQDPGLSVIVYKMVNT